MTPAAGDARTTMIGGAVFLASGASLVLHILTDGPLWAFLAALVAGGAIAAARFVWAVPAVRADWLRKVRTGTIAGLAATGAYDLSRWLLVELGSFHLSPFKALPYFGDALLGGLGGSTGHVVAGVVYHLLNGVTFGVAYAAWFGRRSPWWGVPYALGLEAFMLSLYPGWLDIRSFRELTEVSVFGHVVYGITLGFLTQRLLGGGAREDRPSGAPAVPPPAVPPPAVGGPGEGS